MASLSKPFKCTRGRGGKKSKGKSKPQQQSEPPPPPPEQEEQYEDVNNYYHNDNYRGNSRSHRPYRGQYNSRKPYRGSQQRGREQQNNYRDQYQGNRRQFNPPMAAIIIIIMAIIKVDMAVAMVETITDLTAMKEAIIRAIIITNTINITHMMMDPPCTLCGGFNHSSKHCFKGEHDINNLIEKISLGTSNQHQNGLYQ